MGENKLIVLPPLLLVLKSASMNTSIVFFSSKVGEEKKVDAIVVMVAAMHVRGNELRQSIGLSALFLPSSSLHTTPSTQILDCPCSSTTTLCTFSY